MAIHKSLGRGISTSEQTAKALSMKILFSESFLLRKFLAIQELDNLVFMYKDGTVGNTSKRQKLYL